MNRPLLELNRITAGYPGVPQPVLRDLNLSVGSGEILALAGRSGCGKSTTLRIVSGFHIPASGEVMLDGRVVCAPGRWVPPEERRLGVVFQDHALFPHLTVSDNIAFGLRGLPRGERRGRVAALLRTVGLTGMERRYPHQLSGGQMQRVALARALAPRPRMVLMDEPFNTLDAGLKRRLLRDVRRILQEEGTGALVVTHDGSEAFAVADRIAVMENGTVLQAGKPEELYCGPASREVAELFGPVNCIPAGCACAGGAVRAGESPCEGGSASHRGRFLVRPCDLRLLPSEPAGAVGAAGALGAAGRAGPAEADAVSFCRLAGSVEDCIFCGDYQEVRIGGTTAGEPLIVRCPLEERYRTGQRVLVTIPRDQMHWVPS